MPVVEPLSYVSRPTLVYRARSLVPPPMLDAMVISLVAMALSLVLFGIFVSFSGTNPFSVYRVMLEGSFGDRFAWTQTLITAAPLMLTALCVVLPDVEL